MMVNRLMSEWHLRLVAGRSASYIAHTVLPLHLTTVCDLNFQACLKPYNKEWLESCEEAVKFSPPTEISNILISLTLASRNCTLLFLRCCLQAMIKINADKAANCVQGVSALCSFPLHICHNSARNTNQKGELVTIVWKYAVKVPHSLVQNDISYKVIWWLLYLQ